MRFFLSVCVSKKIRRETTAEIIGKRNARLLWKVNVMMAGVTSDRSSIVKISLIRVLYLNEWTYSLHIYQFTFRSIFQRSNANRYSLIFLDKTKWRTTTVFCVDFRRNIFAFSIRYERLGFVVVIVVLFICSNAVSSLCWVCMYVCVCVRVWQHNKRAHPFEMTREREHLVMFWTRHIFIAIKFIVSFVAALHVHLTLSPSLSLVLATKTKV